MPKKKRQPKKDFTAVGVVAASLMVVVTVFLGWKAANMINPPMGDINDTTTGSDIRRAFLVYRSHEVVDRGSEAGPNDDTVVYDFFRYPLDGSASVGESLAKEVRDGNTSSAGAPWMSKVSDRVLLFVRRADDYHDVIWTDVSGNELKSAADSPGFVWGGLPTNDGSKVAYPDSESPDRIIVEDNGSRAHYTVPVSEGVRSVPLAWSSEATTLFVRTEPVVEDEGGELIEGLWRIDVSSRSTEEVKAVSELGLKQLDIDSASGRLVGVTYRCESLDFCGTAPSALYMVDTLSGESIEIMSSESYVYGQPKFSPDGTRIAFTIINGASDVWVADADISGHERRVVSGSVLDWTPDGNTLVVDRDNELQLVSVSDGTARSVTRRSGKYPDPDFHGVDYVGIILKR